MEPGSFSPILADLLFFFCCCIFSAQRFLAQRENQFRQGILVRDVILSTKRERSNNSLFVAKVNICEELRAFPQLHQRAIKLLTVNSKQKTAPCFCFLFWVLVFFSSIFAQEERFWLRIDVMLAATAQWPVFASWRHRMRWNCWWRHPAKRCHKYRRPVVIGHRKLRLFLAKFFIKKLQNLSYIADYRKNALNVTCTVVKSRFRFLQVFIKKLHYCFSWKNLLQPDTVFLRLWRVVERTWQLSMQSASQSASSYSRRDICIRWGGAALGVRRRKRRKGEHQLFICRSS